MPIRRMRESGEGCGPAVGACYTSPAIRPGHPSSQHLVGDDDSEVVDVGEVVQCRHHLADALLPLGELAAADELLRAPRHPSVE